jgi:hypothetical protein
MILKNFYKLLGYLPQQRTSRRANEVPFAFHPASSAVVFLAVTVGIASE